MSHIEQPGESIAIEPELEAHILAEVDAVADEMIEAIRAIVRQRSVQGEPAEGAPFGTDIRTALDQTLGLCRVLGFETTDVDGYMGYATWPGEKDEQGRPMLPGYVCALGHLDVVTEGASGWKVPPYSAHLEDGRITSRGVLDNKGPIYACLYALWALRRLGLAPRREIRIIFGCNEETGFDDLRHYLTREEPPVMGFTPDCKFPVVYAERGRMNVRLSAHPDKDEAPDALLARFFSFVNDYVLNAKACGERFGIDYADEEFGTTELRNYHLVLDGGAPAIEFAISYPAGITADELRERLEAVACARGLEFTITGNYDPVRFERDCRLVRTLAYTYEHVTGNDGTPVTTTGGTYAKLMPNIVPFGPSFPGQKGIGHQPNEWMDVDDLIACAKIYALSLHLLSR